MPDVPPQTLSVTIDPQTGQIDFSVPESPVVAAGLFMLLETYMRMRVMEPAFAARVHVPLSGGRV